MTGNLILILSMVVPVVLVVGLLALWRVWRKADRRRSPLTFDIRNLPGEHLRRQVAKHEDAYMEAAALVLAVGPIFLSAWLIARLEAANVDWAAFRFGAGDATLAATGLVILGWSAWRMVRHARARRLYLDGLQAELAVAQCLTALIADGAMVFHDLPTGKGNIDHIVIGRGAVFAIETKWRRKPGYKGRDAARVQYDGQQLRFPSHTETKPLEQARYQGKWLTEFLESGVGAPVRVVPVLALPGWYVETTNRSARHELLVSNCHNASFMMGDKFGPPLSEEMRSRIAHVLTQKYPSIDFQ